MIWRLDHRPIFPDPRGAEPDGLVAVGGDFEPERLVAAYRAGVFPWTADPITWWSPDPRAIFELDPPHVPKSLRRVIRSGSFSVTFDRDFAGVISGCAAAPRQEGATWISDPFQRAYLRLHQLGHAHSVEVWNGTDLVGGIYGVVVGGLFAGESMFHRESNASKVGLVFLMEHLVQRGFRLFDIQMLTPVTEALGAIEIPREDYLRRLEAAVAVEPGFGGSGTA
jgi:leucyl/phenylalanyl-tRNA--protein transferase